MFDSENQKESTIQFGLQIEDLAQLDRNTIVDAERIATIFQVSTRTVRRMVRRGELPSPFSMGRRKYWLAGNVLAHLDVASKANEQNAQRERDRIVSYSA